MFHRLIQSRLALVITSVLVTAGVTGGIAWAVSSPVSNGVVHACYNPANGNVQLKVSASCPASGATTPISWGVQGPQGVPGPAAKPAVEDIRWDLAVLPSGTTQGQTVSQTKFTPGSVLKGLDGRAGFNPSDACVGDYHVTAALQGLPGAVLAWDFQGELHTFLKPTTFHTVTNTTTSNLPLVVTVTCENAAHVAVNIPSSLITVVMQLTHPIPFRHFN